MESSELKQPILSIIIATYNASQYLPSTFDSLSVQSVIHSPSVEVIVIDGGSTDETLNQVEDQVFVDKVLCEPDNGIYDAMNKGARLASGRWIQFLNAGDSFTGPMDLSEVLNALTAADIAAKPWVVGAARNLGGRSGVIRRIPSIPHVWWRHAYGLQPHCHQATWFRTSTFLDSGSHSLKYGTADDFDVILRFGLLSAPHVINRTVIDYLGGGISEQTSKRNPSLQHAVRVDRFQLGPVGRRLDKQAGKAVALMNSTRRLVGKLKTLA